jgi:quercetin dioxygenase-like cupin family protein
MLIRTMQELEAQGRVISISHGRSTAVRILTKSDGLNFSISEARAQKPGQNDLWYKNHWEANYVRAGNATLEDRTTGERWALAPGVLYCVGPKDRHRITRDDARLRIVSVFNPPIVGNETHDGDGAYPPSGPIPRGQDRMFVRTLDDLRKAGRVVSIDGSVTSQRYLTVADGLGFSLHSVLLRKGAERDCWYKHHWEGNLVIDGTVEVTDYATGKMHRLEAGGLYLVGPKDRHHIKALTDVHIISVFDPPLAGTERPDADGSYPPTGPVPRGPQ